MLRFLLWSYSVDTCTRREPIFIIYQESKKWQTLSELHTKIHRMLFLKLVMLKLIWNTAMSISCQGCVFTWWRTRFFSLFTGEKRIVSLLRWCEGDSLISSLSHNTLLINETREKGNFDDWYIIKLYINTKNALSFQVISVLFPQREIELLLLLTFHTGLRHG